MSIRYLISIRNIPWTVSHSELENYFSLFGVIKCAKVIFDDYGLSTGYGFVEFYDKFAMNKALCAAHILEEEKLFVVKGVKYLEKEGVDHFLKKYIKHFKDIVEDNHINKNYMEDKYIQKQYRNVNTDNQVSYEDYNNKDVSFLINQLLKHK